MTDYILTNLWQVWLVIGLACLIAELVSGGFFLMCFAIGAGAAALTALAGGLVVQTVVFVVVTVASIYYVRPFAVKYLHEDKDVRPSNADAVIGRTGTVTETIAEGGYGRVAIDGDDWKAQTTAAATLPAGSRVKVTGRDSVIITVVPETANPHH